MNIYGQKIMLRAMEQSDMEFLRHTINDPEMEMSVGGWSFPVSCYAQNQWYESAVNDDKNQRYIIEIVETHKVIGMANLVGIDWKNRSAEQGIKVMQCESTRRKGYALDAVMALQWYAFEQLQLNRIECSILENNIASLNLYKKCGMIIEGTKRKAIFKNGQYYDQICGSILRDEFSDTKLQMGWQPGCMNFCE